MEILRFVRGYGIDVQFKGTESYPICRENMLLIHPSPGNLGKKQ